MSLLIRPYRTGDLPRLQQITVEAFTGVSIDQGIDRAFGPLNGHDWRWRKARHVADDVARDPAGVFVAESDGAVVGYVSTWIDAEGDLGNIPNLAVDSSYRNHGIGRRLLEHALDHFRAHGVGHAKIETLEQNAIGQHLYPSLGFREVARQIHYCAKL